MTFTEEREALLRAVLDEPGEDAPRLVYADWLEEYGDEGDRKRAEFIRVQVELAGMGKEALFCARSGKPTGWHRWGKRCRCRLCMLRRREYETSKRYCVWEWRVGTLPAQLVEYRRGFLDEIRAPLSDLLERGPQILLSHPVTWMVPTDREPCNRCGGHGFHWHPRGPMVCDLPDRLWHNGNPPLCGYWQYRGAALEALYAATLAECRQKAKESGR